MKKKPAAFKATVRTPSMTANIEGKTISGGIKICFIGISDPVERQKLMASMYQTHMRMLARQGEPS